MPNKPTLPEALEMAGYRCQHNSILDSNPRAWSIFLGCEYVGDFSTEHAWSWLRGVLHERERDAKLLCDRAEWLRKEYLAGGDFEHLHTREMESRYVAERLAGPKTPAEIIALVWGGE
jgi:hypothetical protein